MNRRLKFLFWLVGAAACLGPAAARLPGQTWKWIEMESRWTQAPLKIGPLRVRTELLLRDAGFDTNVYGTPDRAVADYTLTAGPQFTIYYPVNSRLLFVVSESPQYVYFLQTRSERTWNNVLRGEAYLSLNRLLFTFGLGLQNAKQRWNAEVDVRPRVVQDQSFGSILWQVSPKTSLSMGFRRANLRFEELAGAGPAPLSGLDHDERFLEIAADYQWTARGRLTLELQSGSFDFTDARSRNDALTRRLSVGFSFAPLLQIGGSFRLGYRWMSPRLGDRPTYGGFVGDAGLEARLSRFVRARVTLARDLPFSFIYSDTYYIWDQIGFGLSLYPLPGIRVDYDFLGGNNAYPAGDFAASPAPHEDTYGSQSLGIVFRVKSSVGIGLTAGQWRRDSAYYGGRSRRGFVGLNLTYDF
jgi:hypothetical protein